MSYSVEEKEIVIVGGGIGGLATAAGLHKKGVRGILVLEKADTLRTSGTAIGIYTNGWRALDQLGVGNTLRREAVPIDTLRYVSPDFTTEQEQSMGKGELRCVKRSDLMNILVDTLPKGTIRFGCNTIAVKEDPVTSYPYVQVEDGSVIKAKVVIGCDGVNSIVSEYLGLKPTGVFFTCGVRGFTNYPSGHDFGNVFYQMLKGQLIQGCVPVNDNLVHWFAGWPITPSDYEISKDPELIKQATIDYFKDAPKEVREMVKTSDPDSVMLSQLKYRAPWDILVGTYRKGRVTVAGDAWHAMGPFLGQGGSSALEDAVVLARNLGNEMMSRKTEDQRIGMALDRYVKQRRIRLFRLSMQTYLMGMMLKTSSPVIKFFVIVAMLVFFGVSLEHTRYNCGPL